MALYVSGVVVDRGHKGQSIGTRILKWCHEYAVRGNLHYLRLDCHAESRWLCGYYLQQGFLEVCRVEQHPGYIGVLLEKQLLVVSQ